MLITHLRFEGLRDGERRRGKELRMCKLRNQKRLLCVYVCVCVCVSVLWAWRSSYSPGSLIAVQPTHLLQTSHLQFIHSSTQQYSIYPGSSSTHHQIVVVDHVLDHLNPAFRLSLSCCFCSLN